MQTSATTGDPHLWRDDGGMERRVEEMSERVYWSVVWHVVCRFGASYHRERKKKPVHVFVTHLCLKDSSDACRQCFGSSFDEVHIKHIQSTYNTVTHTYTHSIDAHLQYLDVDSCWECPLEVIIYF